MINPFRLVVLGIVAGAGAVAFWTYPDGSTQAQGIVITALLIVGLPLLWFAAEADEPKAGRGTRPVPPWIAAPLVPGSGRGALLLAIVLPLSLGSFLAARLSNEPDEDLFGHDDPTQLATICMFAMCYGLAMARAARGWPAGTSRRLRAVSLTVILLAVDFFILLMFKLTSSSWLQFLFFPHFLLEEVRGDGRWTRAGWPAFLVLSLVTAALLLTSLLGMARGVLELAELRRTVRRAS